MDIELGRRGVFFNVIKIISVQKLKISFSTLLFLKLFKDIMFTVNSTKKLCLLTIMFLVVPFLGYSWNTLGGDISWDYLSGDSFRVTLKVYRDCAGTFGATASVVAKCDTTNTTLASQTWSNPSTSADITPVCSKTCTKCSSSSCSGYGIREETYVAYLEIKSGSCCKVKLYFSGSWRNFNLTNGASFTSFYIPAIMNTCDKGSSPKFRSHPRILYCIDQEQNVDFGVIDRRKDTADSIIYELTKPLATENSGYAYSNKFSYDKPVTYWGFPNGPNLQAPKGFNIDRNTGVVTFVPKKDEHSLMAVKAIEYKHGKVVSELVRDVDIITINCPSNNAPNLKVFNNENVKELCANKPFCFSIKPFDKDQGDTLKLIDFDTTGIPGSNFNIYKSKTIDSASFCWTPKNKDIRGEPYTFSFTVSDIKCPYPAIKTFVYQIYVRPEINTSLSDTLLSCGQFKVWSNLGFKASVTWYDKNDSILGTGDTLKLRSWKNGYFRYKAIIKNSACSQTLEDSILINNLTPFNVFLGNDTALCHYSDLILSPTIKSGAAPFDFLWLPDSSTNNTFDVQPVMDTNRVIVFVTDQNECADYDTIYIYKHPILQVDAGNDTLLCRNSAPMPLKPLPSGGMWKGQGIINSGNGKAFNPADTNLKNMSYQLKYLFTDSFTCKYQDSLTIKLVDPPYVSITIDTTVCPKANVFPLSATPLGGQWAGNGIQQIGASWFFNAQGSGVKKDNVLSYTFTDQNNCSNSDNGIVRIAQKPAMNYVFRKEACKGGLEIKLNNPFSGSWSGDGIDIKAGDTLFNPNEKVVKLGQNTIYYDFVGGYSCKWHDSVSIKVLSAPVADFSASPTAGKVPLIVNFFDASIGKVNKWVWHFGDKNNSVSNAKDPIFAYTDITGGFYDVQLVIMDTTNGCMDTIMKDSFITMDPLLGIEEFSHNKIKIYPNPSFGKIYIELNGINDKIDLFLYSPEGKLIFNKENIGSQTILERNNLVNGLYILELRNSKGERNRYKILFN